MGAGLSGLLHPRDRIHLTIGIGSLAFFWLVYRTTRNNGGGDELILPPPTQREPFHNRQLDIRDHDDIPSLPEIVPEGGPVRQVPSRFRHTHFDEDERPAPWHPNSNRKSLSETSQSTTDISNSNANRNTKIQLMRETTFDGLSEVGPLGTSMVCHHHFETPVVATERKQSARCQTKGIERNRESIPEMSQDSVRSKLVANNDITDSASTIRSNKLMNNGKKNKNRDHSREKNTLDAIDGPIIVKPNQIRSTDEENVLKSIIFSSNTLLPLIHSNTRVVSTPELEKMPYTYSNELNCNNEISHVPSALPIIASFCKISPPPPQVVYSPPTCSSNSIQESPTQLKKTPPLSAAASKKVSSLSTTARDSRDSDLEKGTRYIASDQLFKKSKHKLKYPAPLDISSSSENTAFNKTITVPSVEEDYEYNLQKTITSLNSALSAIYSTTQLSLLPVTSNFNVEVLSIASTTENKCTDYFDEGVFVMPSQLPTIESSADIPPPPPSIESPLGRLHSDSRTKSLRGNLSTLALRPSTSGKETLHDVSSKKQKKNEPSKKEISLNSLRKVRRPIHEVSSKSEEKYKYSLPGNTHTSTVSSTLPITNSNKTVQLSAHYVPSVDIFTLFDDIDGCFKEELCIPTFYHGSEKKSFANEQTMPSSSSTRTLSEVHFVPSKRNEQISFPLNTLSSSSRTFPSVPYESKNRYTHSQDGISPISAFPTKDSNSTIKQSSLVTSIYDDPDGSSYEELSVLNNSLRRHTSDENTLVSSAATTNILPNEPSKSKRHDGIHSIHNNDSRIESISSVLLNLSIESLKSIKTSLPDVSSLGKYKNKSEPVGSSIINKDTGLQARISSEHTNHSRTDQDVSVSPSQSTSFSFYSPRSLPSVPLDSKNDDKLVLKAIPSVVIMNYVRSEYQLEPPLVGSFTSINTSSKYDNTYSFLDEDYVAYIPSRDLMEKSQIQKQTKPVKIPLKIPSTHTQYSDSLFSVTSSNNSIQDPVMTLISHKSVPLTSLKKSIEPDQHEYSDYEIPVKTDGHSGPILKGSLTENSSLTHAKASITFKMDYYLSNVDISPEDEVITEPSTITLCQKSETCLSTLNEEVELRKEINNTGIPETTPIYNQNPNYSFITGKKNSSKLETDMEIVNYDKMPEIEPTKMIGEKIQRKEKSRGISQPKQCTESKPRSSYRDPREKIFNPVHTKPVTQLTRRREEQVTTEHNRNEPAKLKIKPASDQPSTSKKKKWPK